MGIVLKAPKLTILYIPLLHFGPSVMQPPQSDYSVVRMSNYYYPDSYSLSCFFSPVVLYPNR